MTKQQEVKVMANLEYHLNLVLIYLNAGVRRNVSLSKKVQD